MNSDDKYVPRPVDMFVKELNQYERRLGWFWFKGKKITIRNKDVRSVQIPYMSTYDWEMDK